MFGGGSKTVPQPAPLPRQTASVGDTSERISGLVDNMQKRQRVLEKEINDLEEQAKKHLATRTEAGKKRAIQCMKRKKHKEKELDNSHAQADGLMQTQSKMVEQENARVLVDMQKQVLHQLERSKLDVDDVAEVAADIAEQHREITEVNEILATPFADDDDDDELLADLENLAADDLEARLDSAEVGTLAPLPVAQPAVTAAEKQKEEDESLLADLLAPN